MAGAVAGCVTAVVTCPLDVLKTRLQNQGAISNAQYDGIWSSLRMIWRQEGMSGMYRGLSPTILGYLPTWTVYFWSYDRYKLWAARRLGRESTDSLVHIAGAVMAGTTSNIVTNPLWLIKTRMMTHHQVNVGAGRVTTLQTARSIYKADGVLGFYRGLLPSLFGVAHVAVQFPLYELLKSSRTLAVMLHP